MAAKEKHPGGGSPDLAAISETPEVKEPSAFKGFLVRLIDQFHITGLFANH